MGNAPNIHHYIDKYKYYHNYNHLSIFFLFQQVDLFYKGNDNFQYIHNFQQMNNNNNIYI